MEKFKDKFKADKNSTFGGNSSIIVSEKKGIIVKLNPASFDSDEEMEFYAKLIASAPEMLEMLEEVLGHLQNAQRYPNEFYYIKDIEKLIEKALT